MTPEMDDFSKKRALPKFCEIFRQISNGHFGWAHEALIRWFILAEGFGTIEFSSFALSVILFAISQM